MRQPTADSRKPLKLSGQVTALFIAAGIMILVGALVWKAIGGSTDFGTSWGDSFWMSWGFFFDPGSHMGMAPEEVSKVRWTGIILSVIGFLFNLVFLGVIVDYVRSFLDYIQRDRNRLFITGHTLVLGWTDKTLFLLREMIQEASNMSKSRKIVILAERDEVEMWQDIKRHFLKGGRFYTRNISVREGCTYDLDDLIRANAEKARDIIVLGCDASPREADLEAVRIMVALASLPNNLTAQVIAEVRLPEVSRVLKRILPTAEGIHSRSSANCILCLLTVEPIIGQCFLSLCSFTGGEELYSVPLFDHEDTLTFGDACRKFHEAVVIGVQPASSSKLILAPPDELQLDKQDQLIVISLNFEKVKHDMPSGKQHRKVANSSLPAAEDEESAPLKGEESSTALCKERFDAANPMTIIILGWPNDFVDIMKMLDIFVPPNTKVFVLATKPTNIRLSATQFLKTRHFQIIHMEGDRTNHDSLRQLPLAEADAILVMAESAGSTIVAGDAEESLSVPVSLGEEDVAGDDSITSDSACLMCTIMVTEMLERIFDGKKPRASIICEVLDPRTDVLLERNIGLSSLAVFFRSNALETGMFTMASSEPAVFNALQLLMSPGVGDLAVVRAGEYLPRGTEVKEHRLTYWDLHDSIREQSGDLLVGWQRGSNGHRDPKRMTGILCPQGSRDVMLTFKESDLVVVIRKPTLGTESPFLPKSSSQEASD